MTLTFGLLLALLLSQPAVAARPAAHAMERSRTQWYTGRRVAKNAPLIARNTKPDTKTLAIGHVAVELPPTARVRQMPVANFKQNGKIHIGMDDLIESGEPLAPSVIRKLRGDAEHKLGPLPPSKVVLYPMSGYDAGTPIHLFPEATTIIGIDNHPFVPSASRGKISYAKVGTYNFSYFGDVDQMGHVGPAVIGALADAIPGFRLRKVQLIEDDDVIAHPRDQNRAHEAAPAPSGAVHAVVEFDAGPGTPLRRYIHVQAALGNSHVLHGGPARAFKNTWWWKAVDALGPQAVLLKGSEGVFDAVHGMARDLRPSVLGWLERSQGVLVEDQDKWAKRGNAAFSELRDSAGSPGRSVSVEPAAKFGYSAPGSTAVHVTVFDRMRAATP